MIWGRENYLSLVKWLFSVLEILFSSYQMLKITIYIFSLAFLTIIFGKGPEQ